MRRLMLLTAAAVFATGAAVAQGPAADEAAPAISDPAQQTAIDVAYRDRCEAKASKELCSCVIAVADSQMGDPAERQVFFDFMMGDVEKAKTSRSMFPPQKTMKFNTTLQKADLLLGEQCDRFKPQQPASQPGEKRP